MRVCIHSKRLSNQANMKLQVRYMGPCMVLRWIGFNTYVLDLLEDMWISPVFNDANLLPYHSPPEEDALGGATFDDSPIVCSLKENFSNPKWVDTTKSLASNEVPSKIPAPTEVLGHHDLAMKPLAQIQETGASHYGYEEDHGLALMPHHGHDNSHNLVVNHIWSSASMITIVKGYVDKDEDG